MPQDSPVYNNKSLDKYRPSRPEDMEVLSEIPYSPAERAQQAQAEPSVEALLEAARGTLRTANERERQLGIATGEAAGGGRGPLPLRASDVAGGVSELLNPFQGGFDLGEGASRGEQYAANVLPYLAGEILPVIGGVGQSIAKGGKAALRGLRGLGKETLESQYPRVLGGTASAELAATHGTRQIASNPNQALAMARSIAAENGEDVASVLKASTKGGKGTGGKVGQAGYGRESAAALQSLAKSGDARRASNQLANMQRNSSFGEGGVMQQLGPSELDAMIAALTRR